MKPAEAALERLIDDLHEGRLRVWSIVITFFGDAVVPRGGVVWLGCLRALMERLRIEPGTLGAAMSRLTADGWLVRTKKGRNTYYALDDTGRQVFERASRRIYGDDDPGWTGAWELRVVPPDAVCAWTEAGWARVDTRVVLRPVAADPGTSPPGPAARFTADRIPAALVDEAYDLGPVARNYQTFHRRFQALRSGAEGLDPVSAMAARTLLIHEFRRVVLKDPVLPPSARPPGWAGHEARSLASVLYGALIPASEAWLSEPDRSPEAPLPPPAPAFWRRFGRNGQSL